MRVYNIICMQTASVVTGDKSYQYYSQCHIVEAHIIPQKKLNSTQPFFQQKILVRTKRSNKKVLIKAKKSFRKVLLHFYDSQIARSLIFSSAECYDLFAFTRRSLAVCMRISINGDRPSYAKSTIYMAYCRNDILYAHSETSPNEHLQIANDSFFGTNYTNYYANGKKAKTKFLVFRGRFTAVPSVLGIIIHRQVHFKRNAITLLVHQKISWKIAFELQCNTV